MESTGSAGVLNEEPLGGSRCSDEALGLTAPREGEGSLPSGIQTGVGTIPAIQSTNQEAYPEHFKSGCGEEGGGPSFAASPSSETGSAEFESNAEGGSTVDGELSTNGTSKSGRSVKKYTKVQRKLVLDIAVALTLEGKGLAQVFREIQGKPGVPPGLTKVTLQNWLDDYFLKELGDVRTLICRERARQIENLYLLYKQCLKEYHESAKPKKKVVRTSRNNSQNGKNGPQGGTKVFKDVVTIEENNVGDPRFLAEARAALRDIRLLCGMESRDVNMIFHQENTINQDNSVGKMVQTAHIDVAPATVLTPIMKIATDDELRTMRALIERTGSASKQEAKRVDAKVVNKIEPNPGRSFTSYPGYDGSPITARSAQIQTERAERVDLPIKGLHDQGVDLQDVLSGESFQESGSAGGRIEIPA